MLLKRRGKPKVKRSKDASMAAFKYWLNAARPRTLPLAIASVGMGILLAELDCGKKNFIVPLLIISTTILLQILSNLANDYGDAIHGADHEGRQGPSRMIQSGKISQADMKRAILLLAISSLISGLILLLLALGFNTLFGVFFFAGLGAIWAAYNYTAGGSPYGYQGFGDLFVFLFFGLVGVLGPYYLLCHHLDGSIILPAASVGALATGVLNLNNIRDIHSDRLASKNTIPVRVGLKAAKIYHLILLSSAIILATFYNFIHLSYHPLQWSFLLVLPLLFLNGRSIYLISEEKLATIDPLLKNLAFTTLLFVMLFCLGQYL